MYYSAAYASLPVALGLYLPQVLLQTLVCGTEQGSDAEAVCIFLISNARLLQQRVQFLSDVRLHLVMTIALCELAG